MTDDFDRTQEIRRDRDWQDGDPADPQAGYARRPYSQQPAAQGTPPPDYRTGGYPPGGARSGEGRPAYDPAVRADKGGSGFPAATIGAVVAAVLMVVSSFVGYRVARDGDVSLRTWDGWFAQNLSVSFWPFDGGSSRATTAFVAGLAIVLFVVLVVLMLATMSTRSGNGGFSVFLSAWMSCVLAGAAARPVAGMIGRDATYAEYLRADIMSGATWGLALGWIVGCVVVAVHLMRRKPASY